MKLANDYGIKTAPTSMIPLKNGQLALLSERLDRGKGKEKYHMEDFCQILGQPTFKKYVSSIQKVAKSLKKYTQQNAPQEQLLRLFELTLFSYIVGNSDLHLKNISVIHDPLPRLSPAYDLLSFEIFQNDFKEKDNEEMALSTNGKKNKLQRYDFGQLAEALMIKEKVRNYIYKKFIAQEKSWNIWISKSFLTPQKKVLLAELIGTRLELINRTPL